MTNTANSRPGWTYVLDERIRLLVVDDDPILREFAVVHLSSPTAMVETAADGLEALARLRSQHFDIVLADIDMPNLDGFGLVQSIRQDPELRYLPVVMVTGREDIVSIDRAYESGATSFVTKPVNWRQISHQLRYVMRTSRMEAEVRAERDRAERAAALKTNMLTVMRHELRTPLNSIIGFAELMHNHSGHQAASFDYAEYALFIAQAGHRLLNTVTELMHYAQMRAGEFELREDVYPLSRLVADAIRSLGPLPPEAIEATYADPSVELSCDREEVVRMLRNLLHNGILHGGGSVSLSMVQDPASGELVLDIADQGPGINPADMPHCLAPFGQADLSFARNNEGLGLGLPIAQAVVALHGGTLTIEPQEVGTLVRVTFPADRVVLNEPLQVEEVIHARSA